MYATPQTTTGPSTEDLRAICPAIGAGTWAVTLSQWAAPECKIDSTHSPEDLLRSVSPGVADVRTEVSPHA